MPTVDNQIILWLLGQTLVFAGGVGLALFRFGRAVATFESIGNQQARELEEMKIEVKTLSKVVTDLALQGQRQDMLESRTDRIERMVDDIRRGEGFILPLTHQPNHSGG